MNPELAVENRQGQMGLNLPPLEGGLRDVFEKPVAVLGAVATLAGGIGASANALINPSKANGAITCPNLDAGHYPPYSLIDFGIAPSEEVDIRTFSNGLGKPGNNWMCTGNQQIAQMRFTVINYGKKETGPLKFKINLPPESKTRISEAKYNVSETMSCETNPQDTRINICSTSRSLQSMSNGVIDLKLNALSPSLAQELKLEAISTSPEPIVDNNSASQLYEVRGIDLSTPSNPNNSDDFQQNFKIQPFSFPYDKTKRCQKTQFWIFPRQEDVYRNPVFRGAYRPKINAKPRLIKQIMPKVFTISRSARFPLKVSVCKGDTSPTIAVQFGDTDHKLKTIERYKYTKNRIWAKIPKVKPINPTTAR